MNKTHNPPVLEIERKRSYSGSMQELTQTLTLNGFNLRGEQREVDTYYSRPDVDFMKTVECLRIRERDNFAEITYKPASTEKTVSADGVIMKQETNLSIPPTDITVAKQLLTNLGMIQLVEVNKLRHSFTSEAHPHLVIAIDDIKGAGIFIEIEVTSSSKQEGLRIINEIEKLLTIDVFPIVTKPYRDICLECEA